MTYSELVTMLKEANLPLAYDHFAEGESPKPPFLVFLFLRSDNFSADGKVYLKICEVHVELYTNSKDPDLESCLESIFDKYDVFYQKTEVWINSERLYEVLYSFETEDK